jgi:hypothetical protein
MNEKVQAAFTKLCQFQFKCSGYSDLVIEQQYKLVHNIVSKRHGSVKRHKESTRRVQFEFMITVAAYA